MAVTDPGTFTYTAEERAAYALGGVFKVLSALGAAAAVVVGAFLALDILAFLVITGLGLIVSALLLFLGYVLTLLVGIHARLGAIRESGIS